MAGAGPFNAYTDVPTFLNHAPGLSTKRFLSLNTQLSSAQAAGVSSLPVLSSSGVTASQLVYILDGAASEIALASASAPAPDGAHVALANPTQFAHSLLASVSTGGAGGALGQIILEAGGWVENYCQQGQIGDRGLYSASRTERLRMPTTRAMLDRYGSLAVRPLHFPVESVSALSIEYQPGVSVTLDASLVELDETQRALRVASPAPTGAVGSGVPALLASLPIGRGDQAWLVLTYTAGVAWASMPWDLQTAANLAVREMLAWQQNPTGAAMARQGDTLITQRLRGSGGKESSIFGIFMSQAVTLLENYRSVFI